MRGCSIQKTTRKMKRYKLLKDTPAFKAGTECYIDEAGNMVPCRGISYTIVHKDQLEGNPNILTDWFEEVKESTRWKPDTGQKYYFLDSNGLVYHNIWADDSIDSIRSGIGNCFETREEAEKAVKKLKAWKRLKESGLKFKDWNKSNYDKTFCINAEVGHDVVAFDFFKNLRTALDMEIDDEA